MQLSRFTRRLITTVAHALLWTAGLSLALYLRFDGAIDVEWKLRALRLLPVLLAIRIVTFWWTGLFHGILRYAGMPEFRSIVRATTIGSVIIGACGFMVHRVALPRSVYVLEWLLALALTGGLRFAIRMLTDRHSMMSHAAADAPPVILLGAGNAGELFVRDLLRNPSPSLRIAGILDDATDKSGALLHGLRIAGAIEPERLRALAEETGAKRAVLAIPTATGARTREIVSMCRELGIALQTIPSMHDIAAGRARVSLLRDINIEDLLRRDPVNLDETSIERFVAGKRVLVTGAAGSIGSEIVRQVARFRPAHVILLDHNENGLFFLERELRESFPDLRFSVRLADIRDVQRIDQVFAEGRPDVVYHAAAHKHVPLMEENPTEAVRNNVLGSRTVADAAGRFGAEAFVLISTDKAVNPTSVMGTTKRIAEMYIQSLSSRWSATRFVAVRFGNVLGSAGSVVPIFREQIERGGPVRVTHPDMRRFFMTIPEACQLVLQAAALGAGGEIFILDMGEPVKIVDLARDMITLSGLRPDVDVEIEFTGMRPGEKLYEELMLDAEAATATAHPKISIANIVPSSTEHIAAVVDRLDRLSVRVTDPGTIRAELAAIVPESRLTLGPPAMPRTAETDAAHEYAAAEVNA